jgi:hypothetical protein
MTHIDVSQPTSPYHSRGGACYENDAAHFSKFPFREAQEKFGGQNFPGGSISKNGIT